MGRRRLAASQFSLVIGLFLTAMGLGSFISRLFTDDAKLPILPTVEREPISINDAQERATPVGALLVAKRSNALTRALAAAGRRRQLVAAG